MTTVPLPTSYPELDTPEVPDDYVSEIRPVDPGKHVAPLQEPVDSEGAPNGQYNGTTSAEPYRQPNIRPFPPSYIALKKKVERIKIVREFEGIVDKVDKENRIFLARMIDLTAGKTFEQEEGEFPIDDLRPDDLPLLEEGALFRVRVAYWIKRGGTRQRFTELIFRRLPCWNERYFESAKQRAAELAAYFSGLLLKPCHKKQET